MDNMLRGLLPEEMLTDHRGMDLQHEEIFSRIEFLRNSEIEDDASLIPALSSLLAYLAEHFAMEQQLAAESGLEFSAHAQDHSQNMHLFNKALSEVAQGTMPPRVFLRYVDYWFEHHINTFDRGFAHQLLACSDSPLKVAPEDLA
jgi:hemerythrin-like metal-binding protein